MSLLNIQDFTYENISLIYSEYGEGEDCIVGLSFDGDMDIQDPDAVFLPYFQDIHTQMTEHNVKKIQLDFRPLRFLNSSGIKVMIKWVQLMLLLPEQKAYTMEILASSSVAWQSNCLNLLSMLAPKLITIKLL